MRNGNDPFAGATNLWLFFFGSFFFFRLLSLSLSLSGSSSKFVRVHAGVRARACVRLCRVSVAAANRRTWPDWSSFLPAQPPPGRYEETPGTGEPKSQRNSRWLSPPPPPPLASLILYRLLCCWSSQQSSQSPKSKSRLGTMCNPTPFQQRDIARHKLHQHQDRKVKWESWCSSETHWWQIGADGCEGQTRVVYFSRLFSNRLITSMLFHTWWL